MTNFKKILLLIVLALSCFSISFSQSTKLKSKKYPSLFWEISGKGLARPSYLFGTMHVSSKMVFHLSDSFYVGLKNADVVALETNPGNWQDDFSRYDLEGSLYNAYGNRGGFASPDDYLSINTLKAFPYEKLMAQALYSSPSIINSFLYRTNSETSSEFEEDTYLDLYIYQIGKKWHKKVCGVENFDESMKLMKEGYTDAAKDKNIKRRNFDIDDDFSYGKLEEAYRTGNLDLLDTINKVNSTSAAFDEKFLYKRNEIQAASIDSILKTKASLFVGVGAAHLPGERGVIEILRRKGYTLRAIKMGARDSQHKEAIEKIRVPVQFNQQTSADGFYSVSLPGKLYSFSHSFGFIDQQQYADMSNGSYYMVSRIHTNAALWGHSQADVQRKIDSVLYENIPGKIISKQAIRKNGYSGFDIVNKTRRGDYQHYAIFITPFEVILFKVSGNGEYVKDSKEAAQFFNSIQLKEYKTDPVAAAWKKYTPSFGGFEVEMPHQPCINYGSNWQAFSFDRSTGTAFEVLRTDVHNLKFAEEDSFDLALMEESFGTSEFIDKQVSKNQIMVEGYAALDTKYKYKDGAVALVRFIVQGTHYYTLIASGKTEDKKMYQFLNSFAIKPFVYHASTAQSDTSLFFTVSSPVPLQKMAKMDMFAEEMYNLNQQDEDSLEEKGLFKDRLVSNDSTGEKIYVSMERPSRYFFDQDTLRVTDSTHFKTPGQDWIYRKKKKYILPGDLKVFEYELGDPKSSRMIRGKFFSKDGVHYRLVTEGDTLTKWSSFITDFFSTFTPVDTNKEIKSAKEKTEIFFTDFFSKDSITHKKAVKNISLLSVDSAHFLSLQKAIQSLTWQERKYLDIKNNFIQKLADVPTRASADYLKEIYFAAVDTVDLQYTALKTLLQQKTLYAYQVFRDIMVNEPPVLSLGSTVYSDRNYNYSDEYETDSYRNNFLDDLSDSLELTKTIFKDLLPLITIDDYQKPIMDLLENMVDSAIITGKEYEQYLSKFLIEAKQEMKKQVISEKMKSIEKAENSDEKMSGIYAEKTTRDYGNSKLKSYAILLLPFYDANASVQQLFKQMLSSNDKRLKYNVAILLLRNKRTISDTLLNYFAGMNDYRFELYTDLKKEKLLRLFPTACNNQADLALSAVYAINSYEAPDTVAYINKMPLEHKGRNGFVYFFKYRKKKEDNTWKLATIGLLPGNLKEYAFEDDKTLKEENEYNFSGLSEQKINNEELLSAQLQKLLKKKLYAKRKSAARFYEEENNYGSYNDSLKFRE